MEQMIPQKQRHPGLAALIEVGILFLPGIPAFFWLWPNVRGSSWDTAVNILAYLYMLAGGLWIGRRRWSLAQLGFNRKGLGLGLICGLVLLAGRTLVILAVEWPRAPDPLTLSRVVGDILFYFGMVAVIEEYIFRGLVYHALDEWRGTRWAIWGSTAGFILATVERWTRRSSLSFLLENPFMNRVAGAQLLLDRADVASGMRVLDVGCGPGRIALPVALRVGANGEDESCEASLDASSMTGEMHEDES
jgi:membrane protease YdiL (CAAX protease family)